MRTAEPRVSVVIVTRNRLPELLATLGHLRALPEEPNLIVVDNASSDGTAEAVHRHYPGVELIALDQNLGAAGRNIGVERAKTPYVAFSDDDSRWEPCSLFRAADLLDAHPRLGLLAARILVGPEKKKILSAERWQPALCRLNQTCPVPRCSVFSPAQRWCGVRRTWR